ncbi:MAG TPA: NlpC/P60 family protein [Leeuwenhoekiella sp.]|nr:NlpC/P60 family protein [Leeuwenhoekiella sp.]
MRKLLFFIGLSCLLASCGSTKSARNSRGTVETKYYEVPADKRLVNIVNDALTYQGTRYKWGGTTRRGMDCSGLVYTAFQSEQVQLPRVSRNMAREGKSIKPREVTIGDLLFFKTERSKRINHVGLVVDIRPGEILFIHSTTSRGVIISSLDENYWKKAYIEARRMI